jgi:hypothetical protein
MLGQSPSFHQNTKIISHCPLCETPYETGHAHLLDEFEDAQLVHLTCKKCRAAVLAVVFLNQGGVASLGLISDLEKTEVKQFAELQPMSSDEVLKMYHELKNKSLKKILEI